MKKISLFYLLFALSSSHSLSAANSDITECLQLGFWESLIFKYKGSLNEKSISLMNFKIIKNKKIINNKKFILRGITESTVCTFEKLQDKFKNFKIGSLSYVVYIQKNGKVGYSSYKLHKLKASKIDDYLKNKYAKVNLRQAVQQRKGYEFSLLNGKLEVKSFNILGYNYIGICILSVIALALVLGTLYILGFFSSSETDKKDETDYIA